MNLNFIYELNPISGLYIRHPFLVAVELSLIIKKSLLESQFFYLFLDPVGKLEKLLLVDLGALFVKLPMVKLHHCVNVLVVHLE